MIDPIIADIRMDSFFIFFQPLVMFPNMLLEAASGSHHRAVV
jgi:hypothetical protein